MKKASEECCVDYLENTTYKVAFPMTAFIRRSVICSHNYMVDELRIPKNSFKGFKEAILYKNLGLGSVLLCGVCKSPITWHWH